MAPMRTHKGKAESHNNRKGSGAADFYHVFADVYGTRWNKLHNCLSQPTEHVALQNAFASSGAQLGTADWHPSTLLGSIQQNSLRHSADCPAQLSGQPEGQHSRAEQGIHGSANGGNPAQQPSVASASSSAESPLPPLVKEASSSAADTQGTSAAAAQMDPVQSQQQPSSLPQELSDMRGNSHSEQPAFTSHSDPNVTLNSPTSLAAQHGQHAAASGSLTCNELDPSRRSRLQKVMDSYLPPALKKRVRLTPHDSARYWGRFEPDTYDCILLDAPCTSERHVLQQAASDSGRGAKLRWSVRQCEDMAALQVRLLTAALKAVKPGGRVVYSTCSISPLENDQVVSKALSILQAQMHISISSDSQQLLKEPSEFPLEPSSASTSLGHLLLRLGAEPTEHGLLVLPDKAGSGPMYVCLLLKL